MNEFWETRHGGLVVTYPAGRAGSASRVVVTRSIRKRTFIACKQAHVS